VISCGCSHRFILINFKTSFFSSKSEDSAMPCTREFGKKPSNPSNPSSPKLLSCRPTQPVSPIKEGSFDYLPPQKEVNPNARGRQRQRLLGTSCAQCEAYYAALNPADRQDLMNRCSRHRNLRGGPRTVSPPNLWLTVDFTEEDVVIDGKSRKKKRNN
jgi:hypothetical protein